jgi:hypothetical protein
MGNLSGTRAFQNRETGENPIEEGLPIRPHGLPPEPKPLMELCSIGGGSVVFNSWPRIPAPHNSERHRRVEIGRLLHRLQDWP